MVLVWGAGPCLGQCDEEHCPGASALLRPICRPMHTGAWPADGSTAPKASLLPAVRRRVPAHRCERRP